MQGGYIGAIATSTGAVLVGFVDEDWAKVTSVIALTGLSAFLIANIASIAQTNKQFANLDSIMPGLAETAAAASSGELATPAAPNALPASTTAPAAPGSGPSIITLGTDNSNQAVSCHVGDSLVITLPVSAGYGWFYAIQQTPILTYSGRGGGTGSPTLTDTWVAASAGAFKLDIQELPVDSSGAAASSTPLQELVYNVTVS
jgi:hypothetical protein